MKKLIYSLCLLSSTGIFAQTATWQQVSIPTTKDLNCIVFPTPQVGYIGGADSLLLKTTDGGLTWNELSYSGITFMVEGDHFMELDFISDLIGFATVGPYSGTYRTADGGLTWTPLTTSMNLCYNHGLYFFTDGDGFVGGSGCFEGEKMDKFTSGTSSPVVINTPTFQSTDMIVDIDFDLSVFAAVGLAVSEGGRILRTTDSGFNWDTIPSSLGNSIPLTSVSIVNSTLAYIAYDNGGAGFGLLISTDGGLTWTEDPNTATFYYPSYHDLHTTPSGKTYVGATSNTTNAGLIMQRLDASTWNMYQVDESIYSMTSYSDTVIWGAGKNGYLVKMTETTSLSVDQISEEESLVIFPNPTADFFTVQLSKELENTPFLIEVYSMDGRLIKTGEPGNKTIFVSDLKTGNYMVKLTQDTRVVSTKLLKIN